MAFRTERAGRVGAAIGLLLTLAGAGCGGSKTGASTTTATTTSQPAATATMAATTTTASGSASALTGEAQASTTGDIPDNQVYVGFTNERASYSMKYPEGWAQSGSGDRVTFSDKNNLVRIVIQPGAEPDLAQVTADMQALKKSTPSLRFQPPRRIQIGGRPALKVVYTTESAPSPVTNKRVQLTVDRYYFAQGGKRAIVDLGTPVGVDNVDGYRLVVQSFRWR